jgi:hypothetical protein
MKASEVIEFLQELIDVHGDKDVAIDDGVELAEITEINLGSEEDDTIVIWFQL